MSKAVLPEAARVVIAMIAIVSIADVLRKRREFVFCLELCGCYEAEPVTNLYTQAATVECLVDLFVWVSGHVLPKSLLEVIAQRAPRTTDTDIIMIHGSESILSCLISLLVCLAVATGLAAWWSGIRGQRRWAA